MLALLKYMRWLVDLFACWFELSCDLIEFNDRFLIYMLANLQFDSICTIVVAK